MEAIITILVLALVGFVVFRTVRYLGYQRGCNASFVKVGKRYNGDSTNGGVTYSFLFSKPTLGFPYRETICQLRIRRSNAFEGKLVTELRIQLGTPLPEMEVTTAELQRRELARDPTTWLNSEDEQLKSLKVASRRLDEVERFLTSPVVWQLEQLRRHAGSDALSVTIRREVLHIKKPGVLSSFQQLDDFVRYALQLYDQMLLSKAKGIEFVNDETASVIDDVKCPICSEDIIHDMVVCTRCKTPHCRDCWQYNGQCATFACSETRYMKVG